MSSIPPESNGVPAASVAAAPVDTNANPEPQSQSQSQTQPAEQEPSNVNGDEKEKEPEAEAGPEAEQEKPSQEMDVDGDKPASQQEGEQADGIVPEAIAPGPDPKLPTRKDMSLREFLTKMDDYAPIIPDAVTNYYMTKAGLPPPPQTDQRLARLLALATQKFVADIAADAYQYSRIRASNSNANNPMGSFGAAAGFPIPGQPAGPSGAGAKDQGKGAPLGIQRPGFGGGGQGGSQNRTVLTMEDLGMAVGEYGVNVKRSEFYR